MKETKYNKYWICKGGCDNKCKIEVHIPAHSPRCPFPHNGSSPNFVEGEILPYHDGKITEKVKKQTSPLDFPHTKKDLFEEEKICGLCEYYKSINPKHGEIWKTKDGKEHWKCFIRNKNVEYRDKACVEYEEILKDNS